MTSASTWEDMSALEGIRTPNLLIRSQMLYPLSYERSLSSIRCSARSRCDVEAPLMSTAVIERLIF